MAFDLMRQKTSLRKRAHALVQRAIYSKIGRKTLIPFLRALDAAGGLAITTRVGAKFVGLILPNSRPLLCTACFSDHGLRLDADRIGIPHALPCPNCGTRGTKKLTPHLIGVLASQFFVRGSVHRAPYGSAPLVQFNELHLRRAITLAPIG